MVVARGTDLCYPACRYYCITIYEPVEYIYFYVVQHTDCAALDVKYIKSAATDNESNFVALACFTPVLKDLIS